MTMIRNLKSVLPIAAAVLALSAVVASSSASAQFHSELETTAITSTADGTGFTAEQVLDFAGGTLACSGVSLAGTQGSKTIPKISPLSVNFTGCTFLGTPTTVPTACMTIRSGGVFDFCGTAKPVAWKVTVGGATCEVQLLPKSNLKELTFHNIQPGSFKEITMEIHTSELRYVAEGKACPNPGLFENGQYTHGNVILTGAESGGEGKMVNIWWE